MARLNRAGDRVLCDNHIRCGGVLGLIQETRPGLRVLFMPPGWFIEVDGVWREGKEARDRQKHGRRPVRIPKGRTGATALLRSPEALPIRAECPASACRLEQPMTADVIRADVQAHSPETSTTVTYWRKHDPTKRAG